MAVNYASTHTYNTDKNSPYSTYTKISDIAGSLGRQLSDRGTKGEEIAGAITSALTGLAKIKDLKGGADKLANTNNKPPKNNPPPKNKIPRTGTPEKDWGGGRSKPVTIGDIGRPISTGY